MPPLLATASGTVAVQTVKLTTPREMDAIAERARALRFRAAGH